MQTQREYAAVALCAISMAMASVGARASIPDDVRACWSFDEGSGTIAHDTSGHGLDGQLYGGATWVPGIDGAALELRGRGMVRAISPAFDDTAVGSQQMTIAGWVCWAGPNPDGRASLVFDGRSGSGWSRSGFDLLITREGELALNLLDLDGTYYEFRSTAAITPSRSDGGWTHLAASYDGETDRVSLYINGIVDGSWPFSEAYHDSYLSAAMGNNLWAPGDGQWAPLNGVLDEVYFYDRALSGPEVSALYRATPEPTSLLLVGLGVMIAGRRFC